MDDSVLKLGSEHFTIARASNNKTDGLAGIIRTIVYAAAQVQQSELIVRLIFDCTDCVPLMSAAVKIRLYHIFQRYHIFTFYVLLK